MNVQTIVGLEIHVQLATRTKLFCGCKLGFGDPPNSNVCPVCLGLPGTLPVMNRTAYEYAVRTALALHCQIARFTKWDRKGYYYPDLPKNYQISQYDLPLSFDGHLEIPLEDGSAKTIRILRAHLEEDAGKNLHEGLDHSRVDLNRTGTPLLEIVTQPDLSDPAECRILAEQLQRLVQYLGVSEANMQEGHMRFEPNINLHITDDDGAEYRTPICEVKNLNSFRALERSVAYEQWRQKQQWQRDHAYTQENHGKQNRGWNDDRGETVFQRAKEEAHDYRYFPEPDLVPIEMDDAWLAEIQASVCELPLARQRRFIEHYGLSAYDAGVLTAARSTAEFFDEAVAARGPAKRVANLITQQGLKIANERGCAVGQIGISAARIGQLAQLIEDGTINASAAAAVFDTMLTDQRDPETIAREHRLIQQSDAAALAVVLAEVLAAHPQAVADVKAGGKKTKKARGFLLGQVMQKTGGQANPQIVNTLLDESLQ
ncbi:MAG: Asp-tRNA(Asn)/Glu-tRNA(Gln) amidotransferase subunit GatB [Sedimentisphaerales bacterium]|nr:Asp-tRNA(Asn)/Glu-tRNA(Gln) amidotransferase subunit GatB [Sedimentisphaerales bacterium]